jgi:cyclopropane-fatty-acyl-phospholipid synthase
MPLSWLDRALLSNVRKAAGPASIRVAMGTPDPSVTSISAEDPTIWIRDRQTLLDLARNPQVNFGDLYSEGRIQVEGDLLELIERMYHAPITLSNKFYSTVLNWLQSNSLGASRRNIHHHYDLSNDFYQLWLDRDMLYTCAYFPNPDVTLEEAQTAKMNLVCRKLWLRPGETVVEAGCGWGALALHMAAQYGVKVKAFNISREQIGFAQERARRAGLSSQVEFIEDDYRNIRGHFDAFVSVGMLEHVGKSHYREFSQVIRRTIGEQGRGLLHFIGRNHPRPLSAWIRKRIFPGGYAPTLREAAEFLEPHDYSVLDVENLRMHYARTIGHWRQRFEDNYDTICEQFSPCFARMWHLYLTGSMAAFRTGSLQLFQLVFAGRQCATQPWNRAYLYEAPGIEDESCARATS